MSEEVGNVRSILIFGFMGVGDVVMFEPALTAILKKYNQARIDLVLGHSRMTREIFESIASSAGAHFRNVYPIDFKAQFGEVDRLNRLLASRRYDLCLCTYTAPIPYFLNAIASCRVRAGHRIRSQKWYRPRANFLLNLFTSLDQSVNQREPERYMELAHALGVPQISVPPIPKLPHPAVVDKGYRLIAVQLGVSPAMQWKKWPLERYLEVFAQLSREGFAFRVFGTRSEGSEITELGRVMNRMETFIDEPLDTVTRALAECSLFIGNDSGIGHIATALSIPTVRIFGPSDRYGCEPYDPMHQMIYHELTCSPCWNLGMIRSDYNFNTCGHRNCLNHITTAEVLKSVRRAFPS